MPNFPRDGRGGSVGTLPIEFFGISRLAQNLRGLSTQLDEKKERKKAEDRQDKQDVIDAQTLKFQQDMLAAQNSREEQQALQNQTRFDEATVRNQTIDDQLIALGFEGGSAGLAAQMGAGELSNQDVQRLLVEAQTTTEGLQPELIQARMGEIEANTTFRTEAAAEQIRQFDLSLDSDQAQFDRQMALSVSQGASADSQFRQQMEQNRAELEQRREAAEAAAKAADPMAKARVEEAIEIARVSGLPVDAVFMGIENPGAVPQLDEIIQLGRSTISERAGLEAENIRASMDMERVRALMSIISTKGMEGSEAAVRTAEVALQQMFEAALPGLATFGTAETGAFWWKEDVTELTVNTELMSVADGQTLQQVLDGVAGNLQELDPAIVQRAQQGLTAALALGTPEAVTGRANAVIADETRSDAEKQMAEAMILLLELQEVDPENDSGLRDQIVSENGEEAEAVLTDSELQTKLDDLIAERDRLQSLPSGFARVGAASRAQTAAAGGAPGETRSLRAINKVAAEAREVRRELIRRRANR